MPSARPPVDAAIERRGLAFGAAAVLVAAVVGAYANTFRVPVVFDDIAAITQNPTIEHFFTALAPPPAMSVSGRPFVNVTLALNHAISGQAVWSYHVFSLALHIICTLTLFAILRATLASAWPASAGAGGMGLGGKAGQSIPPNPEPGIVRADRIAFATALFWAVHPLHTATVTYLMQRTELLASACYLLTLYCFARGASDRSDRGGRREEAESPRPVTAAATASPAPSPALWFPASILFCALGMASKEVMVSAPLIVLLYDRTFVSGSFRAAGRAHGSYYAMLAATWLVLLSFVFGTSNRGGSAGFDVGMSPVDYGLTQLYAIAHYLRLAVWPAPLVFDYGTALVLDAGRIVASGAVIALLVAGTAVALRRWPAAGFCGVSFFALLAPSSSVVPVATQVMAEHRIHLALALPVLLVVLGLYRRFESRVLPVAVPLAVVLAFATFTRNRVYATAPGLWADTVRKMPGSVRAHFNYGLGRLALRDLPGAEAEFNTVLHLEPGHLGARQKLGETLLETGRPAEALPYLQAALRLRRSSASAHYDLGMAHLALGHAAEGARLLAESIRINPKHAPARYNYGRALADLQRYDEALVQFEEAARLDSGDDSARRNAARLREFLKK